MRAARDAMGLKRLELYAHPDDWPQIKALAADQSAGRQESGRCQMTKAQEKAKPGRKPLPDGKAKTERVQLRIRPGDKAAWMAKAAAAGLSLQEWVEMKCNKKDRA